jgi:hypothetical protein
LGDLARHAHAENLAKIKSTWPEYWKEYEAARDYSRIGRRSWSGEMAAQCWSVIGR